MTGRIIDTRKTHEAQNYPKVLKLYGSRLTFHQQHDPNLEQRRRKDRYASGLKSPYSPAGEMKTILRVENLKSVEIKSNIITICTSNYCLVISNINEKSPQSPAGEMETTQRVENLKSVQILQFKILITVI